MAILGIDVGTTHSKAGLFQEDGSLLNLAVHSSGVQRSAEGYSFYDPEQLWQTVLRCVQEVMSHCSSPVKTIGISSMAETGLLVDRRTGQLRSAMIPWFDTAAAPQAEKIANLPDPLGRFCRTGIYPTFKCSLAKILWLRERNSDVLNGAVWLSAADYIAFRFTGALATDFSLAGRTYAFDLQNKTWDAEWLAQFDLKANLFPPAFQSGFPVGPGVQPDLAVSGIEAGTTVAVCGHDHICAAFAEGVFAPGRAFDSMGTAESLVGAIEECKLGAREYQSGLSYGVHVSGEAFYWMGGLSTSGGAIEWLRSLYGNPPLSYQDLEGLLEAGVQVPTGILFLPYLAGSGSPHSGPAVRGALIGLNASHGRADILAAVLEGTAYEVEFIRQAAQRATGLDFERMTAAGGGVRNQRWLQIKADITGCTYEIPEITEATLLGAAMVAALRSGIYTNLAELRSTLDHFHRDVVIPDPERHAQYREIYEQGYLYFQDPLRSWSKHAPSH